MGITYEEVATIITRDLYETPYFYVEIKNGNITMIVQIFSGNQFKLKYFHKETGLIVQSELIMKNDSKTLKLIHESLELLENSQVWQVQMLQEFTSNILAIRLMETGEYDCEFYKVANILEYLQIRELFSYDESIKDVFDDDSQYSTTKKVLRKYGIVF